MLFPTKSILISEKAVILLLCVHICSNVLIQVQLLLDAQYLVFAFTC
jgi:hypothetical protein